MTDKLTHHKGQNHKVNTRQKEGRCKYKDAISQLSGPTSKPLEIYTSLYGISVYCIQEESGLFKLVNSNVIEKGWVR